MKIARIGMTIRIWRYTVGSRGTWVDAWLMLQGYKNGHVLTWREAWDIAGRITR